MLKSYVYTPCQSTYLLTWTIFLSCSYSSCWNLNSELVYKKKKNLTIIIDILNALYLWCVFELAPSEEQGSIKCSMMTLMAPLLKVQSRLKANGVRLILCRLNAEFCMDYWILYRVPGWVIGSKELLKQSLKNSNQLNFTSRNAKKYCTVLSQLSVYF